jgi:hypothetical protein
MRYYNIQYFKRGKIINSPLTSKQNAIYKYITALTIRDNVNKSDLKILKHLKNGKIIDISTQVNKFLKS